MNKTATIGPALQYERWRLEPVLKTARARNPSATMEDVAQRRDNNFNLGKRPRKFNSWAPNRTSQKYQSDLLLFYYLRQPMSAEASDTTKAANELVG